MGFDERSDTTQHPANVVPLEMEEDDFDGFEDARSDPGDVGAAGGASAAGGSLAALEASADEFFESVQTGAAFAQGATVDSSAATPADPPSTASATDSAAAAGGASSATSASGPVVGGAGTADGGAAAGTATSSTDDAAPADGSPVAAGDGSASGGAADDASPPPAAAADDAGGLPDLIAPDGRVIRRRRRTITEADEVEDGKKSLEMATACKEEGNRHFGKGAYETAAACYTEALRNVPRGAEHDSQRAVYYCNRAACHMHAERYDEALYDCDRAIESTPTYVKALMRRSAALEKFGKLDEAKADIEAWLAMEPHSRPAQAALAKLTTAITERDEKLKEEMLGKLKDMGNWVLGKFGLSMDNFKAVKDPATGSYSISFQQ